MLTQINNIIFDLGGVILNIDPNKTDLAFARLAEITVEELKQKKHACSFFDEYEKGLIVDQQFRQYIRESLNINATDEQLNYAWNAMLLDIPQEKINLLKKIGKRYRIFLLSNTNNIHLQFIHNWVFEQYGNFSIDSLFESSYYSHLIHMRKPNVEIYEYVLKQNNLAASQTVFLDDNLENLTGAASIGIKTFQVTHPDLLYSLFK